MRDQEAGGYKKIPSPKWLRESTMCTRWERGASAAQFDAERIQGIPLLINVNATESIEAAHKKGFRGISYVGCMDTFVGDKNHSQ